MDVQDESGRFKGEMSLMLQTRSEHLRWVSLECLILLWHIYSWVIVEGMPMTAWQGMAGLVPGFGV